MDIEYLNKLLSAGVKHGASDIHLKVGRSPMYRIDGRLREMKRRQIEEMKERRN